MFKPPIIIFFFMCFFFFTQAANATLVRWELENFNFDDGGSATGTFVYDTELGTVSDINIYTLSGSRVEGRHYIATAGSWGRHSEVGLLVFTDTSSTEDYQGAGWFRFDIREIRDYYEIGRRLRAWNGAESYCVNSECSSAASIITDPDNYRRGGGGIIAIEHLPAVPLPAAGWLFLSAIGGLFWTKKRAR